MSHEQLPQGISSRAVHGGERQQRLGDAITVPIYQTSTYVFRNTQELIDFKEGRIEKGEYGRYGNPTVHAAERKLAELEHADDALLWASGMCAITSVLLTLLRPGHHMIITADSYRRTRQFCDSMLRRLGIEVAVVPPGDPQAVEAAVQPNTRLLFSEAPTNPYLYVADLEQIVAIAKRHRLRTMIDSTFATPYNQNPLDFGIDLVMHSATKYLGGHNDIMTGVVAGNANLISALREAQGVLGGITDPNTAYLLLRGLKTFALRMQQHNANGLALAQFVSAHPKVKRVYYPGLPTHPQHELAKTQMNGFGGMLAFDLGSLEAARRLLNAVRLHALAESLGGVETLISHPATMTHASVPADRRAAIRITDGLVRISAGIEDIDDLKEDLSQALEAV